MSAIESSLKQTLEVHPHDWAVRFLVAEKMLERDAREEAVALIQDAPSPPTNEHQLQRAVEIAEEGARAQVEKFVEQNPASAYGHELFAAVLEWLGEHEKSGQHLSVASALSGAPVADPPTPEDHSVPAAPGEPGEETISEELAAEFGPPPLSADLMPTAPPPTEQVVGPVQDLVLTEPPKQRGKKATAAFVAIGFHLVVFLIAALVVILPEMRDEPEIVAAIQPGVEKKQEMQKKNVVKQTKKTTSSAAAAAPMAQLMRANAVAKIALPNVTRTSKGPLGIGDADLGGGGFGSGGGGLGSGASFFGGSSTGRRFLFILDHSGSMKKNQVDLRNKELEKALESLRGVQYQVLLFAGGGYYASKGWSVKRTRGRDNRVTGPEGKYDFKSKGGFADYDFVGNSAKLPKAEWLSTTPLNVEDTMDRVKKDPLFGGTDWGLAFDIGHHMDPPPDVIFFMADGTGGNTPGPILKTNQKFGRPVINMVAMQTTAGLKEFARIAEETRGSFTIVDKRGKPIDGFDYRKSPSKYRGRL